MKKLLLKYLALIAFLISSLSVSAFEIDGIEYVMMGDGTIAVTSKYPKYYGDIVIPSTIEYCGHTYKVTSIGHEAFYGCSGLTSVVIPNSITSIDEEAFFSCSGLKSVEIPNSVTSIGPYTFSNCSGVKSVVIGNSVTSIGKHAFSFCSGLKEVSIEEGEENLEFGQDVFKDVPIENLYLGRNFSCTSSKTSDHPFRDKLSIKTLTIGSSVTSIGSNAFNDCRGLKEINIADGKRNLEFGISVFDNAPLESLYLGRNFTCTSSDSHLPFYDKRRLKDLTIGNSVTSIGSSAFFGCCSLTSLVIPSSVTSIGSSAFYGCSDLKSVEIPNSVISIGSYAFYGCSSLKSVEIPSSIISIDMYAFSGCRSLKSVEIPNSVTTIAEGVFSNCGSLTSVVIPNSVTSIGCSAFKDCTGLTKAEFSSVEVMCKIKFDNYDSNPLCYAHNLWISGQEIKDLVIPTSITSIEDYTFRGCSGLISIVIPNSVTSIGCEAFCGCSGLTSLEIPSSVTSIGERTFSWCKGLKEVRIDDVDTNLDIGSEAFGFEFGVAPIESLYLGRNIRCTSPITYEQPFSGITSLKTLIISNSVTSVDSNAFSGCSGLREVAIADGDMNLVFGSDVFKDAPIESLYLGRDFTYKITSSVEQPPFRGNPSIKTLTIGNYVTTIGLFSFSDCIGLTSVIIRNSVLTIGAAAFYNCRGLTSVTLGNSVESIEFSAFSGCNQLSSIRCDAPTPPLAYDSSFEENTYKNAILIIPESLIQIYNNDAVWGKFINKQLSIPVSSIEINPKEWIGSEDDQFTITATIAPADATDQTVTWTSSDASVATVDADGKVTAIKAGSATITATTANGKTATCAVTVAAKVIEVAGITLDKTELSLTEGDTATLTATIAPADATDKSVTWTSSDSAVASVDADGKVTAVKAGNATITATTANGKSASCTVTVAAKVIDVTGITLDKTTLSLTEGETTTLTATIAPADATDKSVTWTSSDTAVATVDADGKVTALKAGTATITATTANGKTATCAVTVAAKVIEVTGITLDKTTLSLTEGETATLTATIAPADATDKSVTWTSSDASVATVDAQGKVTAMKAGNATITATTANGKTATCAVTVAAKAPETILVETLTIDPTAWNGEEGSEFSITATMLPEDATNKAIAFKSSDEDVATVDTEGNVKVLKEGTCTIIVATTDGSNLTAECVITSLAGVEAIFGEDALVDVYDISGVPMKKEASREDLKQLTPGIYILRSGNATVKALIR